MGPHRGVHQPEGGARRGRGGAGGGRGPGQPPRGAPGPPGGRGTGAAVARAELAALAERQRGAGGLRGLQLLHPLQPAGGGVGGGAAATCATPPLYSIFLPKSERKRVLVVRHGESQFNAADAHGTSWSDPNIFDAPLTARGHAQARALREQMLAFRDALWVTSPLSRAMQTCLDACPWRTPTGEPELPAVVVRPEIAEHCATSGDVGRPRAALIRDFPLLADQLRHLPDVWWWSPPGRPNDSELKQFSSAESRAQMATRVEAFRAWVLRRP